MFQQRAAGLVPALPQHQLSASVDGWMEALQSPATPDTISTTTTTSTINTGIFSQSFAKANPNTVRTAAPPASPFSESVVLIPSGSDLGDSDTGLDSSSLTLDALFGMFESQAAGSVDKAASATTAPVMQNAVPVLQMPAPAATYAAPAVPQQQQQEQPPQQQQHQSPLALPTPPSGSSAPVLHIDTAALQILGGSAASIFGSNPATPGSSPLPEAQQSARSDHSMLSGGVPSPVPFGLSVQIPAASADIASPYGSAASGYLTSASMCSSPNETDFEYDSSSNSSCAATCSYGSLAAAAAKATASPAMPAAATAAAACLPKRGGRVGPTRTRTKSARAVAAAASSRLQIQIQQEEEEEGYRSSSSSAGGGSRSSKRTSRKNAPPSHQPYLSPRGKESVDAQLPEYTGPLPNSYWELNEAMIASISYKDFTDIIVKSKLTAKQVADAKKVRRRVKNRHSARLCSTRRRDKCQSTEDINQALKDRLAKSQSDNALLIDQIAALKEAAQDMEKGKSEAIRQKIAMQAKLNRMQQELERYSK